MPDASPGNDALDPQAVALAQAIRQQESAGNPNAVNGGHYGAYQFDDPTWAKAAKAAGVTTPLHDAKGKVTASLEEQNQVAYGQIKGWKDRGLNPGQIASAWYTGRPDQIDNATPQKGGPSPADYVQSVFNHYQSIKAGQPPQPASSPTAPASAPAALQQAPEPAETAPWDRDPMAAPPEAATPAGPEAAAPPVQGETPIDTAYNAGNQAGSNVGELSATRIGAEGMIPGAPYLGALASYLPKELGGADVLGLNLGTNLGQATREAAGPGASFSQRVAAARGVLSGSTASHPVATIAGELPVGALATFLTGGGAGAAELGWAGATMAGAKAGAALTLPTAALNAITGQTSTLQAGVDTALGAAGGAFGALGGKALTTAGAALLRNALPILQKGGRLPTAAMQKITELTGMSGDEISAKLAALQKQGITARISNVLPESQTPAVGKFSIANQEVATMARKAQQDSLGDQRAMFSPSPGTKSPDSYWADVNTQADKDFGALRAQTIPLSDGDKDFLSGDPVITSAIPGIVSKSGIRDRIDNGAITGSDFDLIRKALGKASRANPGSTDIAAAEAKFAQIGAKASPEFEQALANYRLGARKADAAELGHSILNSNEPVDAFATKLATLNALADKMSIPRAELVKPFRDGAEQAIGTLGQKNPASAVNTIATDDVLHQKWALTFGQTAAVKQRMMAQAQDQANKVLNATVPRLGGAEPSDVGNTAALHSMMAIKDGLTLDPGAIYHGLAAGMKMRFGAFSKASQQQIADWMHSADPAKQAEAVQIAKGVQRYWDRTRLLIKSFGASTGAATPNAVGGAMAP